MDVAAFSIYQSNETPFLTTQHWTRKIGNCAVKRRGRRCVDHLVQRSITTCDDAQGHTRTTVKFMEPTALFDGVTAWHLDACPVDELWTVSEQDFDGAALSHCCSTGMLQCTLHFG